MNKNNNSLILARLVASLPLLLVLLSALLANPEAPVRALAPAATASISGWQQGDAREYDSAF